MIRTMTAWAYGFMRWVPSFWTNWCLAVFLYDHVAGLPPSLIPSARFMLCTASAGGIWMTYVKGKLVIRGYFPVDLRLSGWVLMVADLITHQIPLYLMCIKNRSGQDCGPYALLPAYTTLACYTAINPIWDRYRMYILPDMVAGIICAHVLYALVC